MVTMLTALHAFIHTQTAVMNQPTGAESTLRMVNALHSFLAVIHSMPGLARLAIAGHRASRPLGHAAKKLDF